MMSEANTGWSVVTGRMADQFFYISDYYLIKRGTRSGSVGG